MNCDVNAAGQGQNVGCSIQAPINTLSTSIASTGNFPGNCLAHLRYEPQPRGRRILRHGVDNRVNQYLVLPLYRSHTQRHHKQYSQPQWLGYPAGQVRREWLWLPDSLQGPENRHRHHLLRNLGWQSLAVRRLCGFDRLGYLWSIYQRQSSRLFRSLLGDRRVKVVLEPNCES